MSCHVCDKALNSRETDRGVCSGCYKSETFISKTAAKNKYLMTDDDLDGLFFYTKMFFRNLACFYWLNDIETYANRHHPEWREKEEAREQRRAYLEATKEERAQAKAKKAQRAYEKAQQASEARRQELTEALRIHGLSLRSDSKLCNAYIEGGLKTLSERTYGRYQTISDIVETMLEMAFYYDHTDYDSLVSEAYEDHFNDDNPYRDKDIEGCTDLILEDSKRTALYRYIEAGRDLSLIPISLQPWIAKIQQQIVEAQEASKAKAERARAKAERKRQKRANHQTQDQRPTQDIAVASTLAVSEPIPKPKIAFKVKVT